MPAEVVIAWVGDAGAAENERARADIDRAVDELAGGRLILDFSEVGFVEPVAVGALVHAGNRAAEHGGTVVLRAMPSRVKRLLAMTGLTELFTFDDPTPTEVVAADLPRRTMLPAVADEEFDDIAELVRQVLIVPTAQVNLVGRDEQVVPGAAGVSSPTREERRTELSHSFCKYVVARAAPLVLDDAREDPFFADSPVVTEMGIVAYAGMPLTDVDGRVVGALCAVDSSPRTWTEDELTALRGLAMTCSAALRLRTLARRRRD